MEEAVTIFQFIFFYFLFFVILGTVVLRTLYHYLFQNCFINMGHTTSLSNGNLLYHQVIYLFRAWRV